MNRQLVKGDQLAVQNIVILGRFAFGTVFAIKWLPNGKEIIMSEESTEEIKLDSPRKPLEPVGGKVSDKQRAAYAKLLAEYERIDGIRDTQVEGVSISFDKEKKSYTVEEYNAELKSYRAARAAYNKRYADSIETIEMVRAKLDRMQEEDEQYEKEHPDVECPDVPEMEDIPDEPWEDFKRRFDEYSKKLHDWNEQFAKSNEKTTHTCERLRIRMEEMSKFPELEYELEMRLRHTYIDPKTGEHLYRPDDDVGGGLICVGSRDYTPVLKDE